MDHFARFQARETVPLPLAEDRGWRLKRYAIVADGRALDHAATEAATMEAMRRLPEAGALQDASGNHGIGFQIIHFAEQLSAVSPVFYWQWGSVLANIDQMRATWAAPSGFGDGVREVVGCVWEMQVVAFEMEAWTRIVLGSEVPPKDRISRYLNEHYRAAASGEQAQRDHLGS